ncbi:hypothetical protein PWT90_07500 [Aphanocladium album]|nr:hypothetical protein PWT90_07500 [Aphanocladium album]
MAELALAVFGVALPLAQAAFAIHARLGQIRHAPAEILLFMSETHSLGICVQEFRLKWSDAIEKLSSDKKQEAVEQLAHMDEYLSLVDKNMKSASNIAWKAFASNDATIWEHFWARWKWVSKKDDLLQARYSMTLLVTFIHMIEHRIFMERLLEELTQLRTEGKEVPLKILENLELLREALKRDRQEAKDARKEYIALAEAVRTQTMISEKDLDAVKNVANVVEAAAKRAIKSILEEELHHLPYCRRYKCHHKTSNSRRRYRPKSHRPNSVQRTPATVLMTDSSRAASEQYSTLETSPTASKTSTVLTHNSSCSELYLPPLSLASRNDNLPASSGPSGTNSAAGTRETPESRIGTGTNQLRVKGEKQQRVSKSMTSTSPTIAASSGLDPHRVAVVDEPVAGQRVEAQGPVTASSDVPDSRPASVTPSESSDQFVEREFQKAKKIYQAAAPFNNSGDIRNMIRRRRRRYKRPSVSSGEED